MSPLVTVILPTFERARYLREAIDSALAQTYGDFVLSVGDNSRDDTTEQAVREYDDPRITYRRHPENLGQQGNWLWLIENATTPYVASLHDDDVWMPDFLERTVPMIDGDPSVSMVFGDYELIDADGRLLVEETEAMTVQSHRDRPDPGPRPAYRRATPLPASRTRNCDACHAAPAGSCRSSRPASPRG